MPKKVDANQAEIVAALRLAGYSVQDLHTIGHGCPDLVVGVPWWANTNRFGNVLMEVKSATGKLNSREALWHADWRGQVAIVHNVDEALRAVGLTQTGDSHG